MIVLYLLLTRAALSSDKTGREIRNFNFDWKFYKGNIAGGQNINLDDSGWRDIDLPHDWSIEGPFSKENSSCTGYLPGGIGWYRKTFTVPKSEKNRKIYISFDGIYNNSEVWINENYLGERPNGYISFQYDITPFIKYGKKNTVAVKADHSQAADSRWYTGSGIYRPVKLISTPAVHIGHWGVYITTPQVSETEATLSVKVTVSNESGNRVKADIINYLLSGNDTVGSGKQEIELSQSEEKEITHIIQVKDPVLWNVDNPALYNLVTLVKCGKTCDNITTSVGFRTLRFDPDKGFFLNGKNMKLKGICMHHDAGALGAAVPEEEMARRLDILKELGCNAIRTSHNPFSPEFIDLCDQKGFLVIGEAFDEWELPKKKWLEGWNVGTPGKQGYAEYFSEWGKKDLRDFILRDRNHPSVIMWSIGNEVDYPNDPYTHPVLNTEENPQTWAKFSDALPHADRLGEVARELVALIKELDKTRPVTAGLASALMSNETGYAEALDVAGYNYQEFRYAPDHKRYPARPLYGSENGMTLEMWNYVADNDYVMGQFLWTGIEYLGEAGRFPIRSNSAGIIDLAGNKKPEFYFRQSLWSDKPMVFIGTTDRLDQRGPVSLWAHKRVEPVWNYEKGKIISINVFSNCEEVELFMNSSSLGSKKMEDFKNRTMTWEMPFEEGVLKAVAKNSGNTVASYELRTTTSPLKLVAVCDKSAVRADRQELARIFVNIADEAANTVYKADNEIICEIEGPARLLGMEDANHSNTEDYKDNKQHAFHGRLLIYLQASDKPGQVTVSLNSPGLQGTTVRFNITR